MKYIPLCFRWVYGYLGGLWPGATELLWLMNWHQVCMIAAFAVLFANGWCGLWNGHISNFIVSNISHFTSPISLAQTSPISAVVAYRLVESDFTCQHKTNAVLLVGAAILVVAGLIFIMAWKIMDDG